MGKAASCGVGAASAITGDVVEAYKFSVTRVGRAIYFGCGRAIGTDALDDAHDGPRFPRIIATDKTLTSDVLTWGYLSRGARGCWLLRVLGRGRVGFTAESAVRLAGVPLLLGHGLLVLACAVVSRFSPLNRSDSVSFFPVGVVSVEARLCKVMKTCTWME